MNLREWIFNSQGFLDRLPSDQRLTKAVVKFFGLSWNRIGIVYGFLMLIKVVKI